MGQSSLRTWVNTALASTGCKQSVGNTVFKDIVHMSLEESMINNTLNIPSPAEISSLKGGAFPCPFWQLYLMHSARW